MFLLLIVWNILLINAGGNLKDLCISNVECNSNNCNDIGRCGPGNMKIKEDSDNPFLIVTDSAFKY